MDKLGNLHVVIGKRSFEASQLAENGTAVLEAILRAKPSGVKGTWVRQATLSSTMSPGIPVDMRPLESGITE